MTPYNLYDMNHIIWSICIKYNQAIDEARFALETKLWITSNFLTKSSFDLLRDWNDSSSWHLSMSSSAVEHLFSVPYRLPTICRKLWWESINPFPWPKIWYKLSKTVSQKLFEKKLWNKSLNSTHRLFWICNAIFDYSPVISADDWIWTPTSNCRSTKKIVICIFINDKKWKKLKNHTLRIAL